MLLYRILSRVGLLLYSPFALARSWSGHRRLPEIRGRLGNGAIPDLAGGIWLHAVSVGEVGVARNLLPALSRKAPGARLGLSVTTAAGRELAERLADERAPVFWFPFDLLGPVERTLSESRAGLILLAETELWPLLLDRATARGIPVALVNGRISQRSFTRYRLLGRWFRGVLNKVALFAMQTEQDAERIRILGAEPWRVRVTGNVKYDLAPAPPFSDAERLADAAAERPILVAASTAEGEEKAVLDAWKRLPSRPFLVLAPRRPERFELVARLVEKEGWRLLRRSTAAAKAAVRESPAARSHASGSPPDVYLLDSIGELASLYGQARLAFVGGSLVAMGGHNPIEAWAQGVPVLVGPHTENFRQITRQGEELGILRRVADATRLSRELAAALSDHAAISAGGERAKRFVAQNRGAAARTADLVLPLLEARSSARSAAP